MRRFAIVLALVSTFTAFSADAPSLNELADAIKVLPDPVEPSRIELSDWEGYPGKEIVLQYTAGGGLGPCWGWKIEKSEAGGFLLTGYKGGKESFVRRIPDAELLNSLSAFWAPRLRSAHAPPPAFEKRVDTEGRQSLVYAIRLDGETSHFYVRYPEREIIRGTAYTPQKGSIPELMSQAAASVYRFGDDPARSMRSLRRELNSLVRRAGKAAAKGSIATQSSGIPHAK